MQEDLTLAKFASPHAHDKRPCLTHLGTAGYIYAQIFNPDGSKAPMPIKKLTDSHLTAIDMAVALGKSAAEVTRQLAEGIPSAVDEDGQTHTLPAVSLDDSGIRRLIRNRSRANGPIAEARKELFGAALAANPLSYLGGRLAEYTLLYERAAERSSGKGRDALRWNQQALRALDSISSELGRFEPTPTVSQHSHIHVSSPDLLAVVASRLGELQAANLLPEAEPKALIPKDKGVGSD